MRAFLPITLALLLIVQASQATIRRVGFFAPPVAGTDYATFALAYTAAAAGDTIMVFPGIPAISQTVTKKITIIGPGSWLDATTTPKGNAALQAFPGTVTIGTLTFTAGSEGSVVMGLENGVIFANASDLTIRRTREVQVYLSGISTATSYSNIQILENYRVNIASYYNNGSSVTNLNISNNLIANFATAPLNTYNGNISNNVWAYDGSLAAAVNGGSSTMSLNNGIEFGGGAYLVQNNIFVSLTNTTQSANYNYFSFVNATNSVFNYNLALQAPSGPAQTWGVGTGNVITPFANAANIFDGFPTIGSFSADARYRLKAGSPALTVGAGNTPIGMFAGNNPYKLGMVPSVPSIYLLTSPQGNNPPGNTIQINVSTRGNN